MATKKEHLLIDGYNLIKSSQLFQGRGDSLERARNCLQQALAAYARRADKHITLYYDGTGESSNTTCASGPSITIQFSRYPQQADDLIAQAVQKKHGAKWLRVISSDRAVQRCAARHKIRSTCSEDFIDELTGPAQAAKRFRPCAHPRRHRIPPIPRPGRTRPVGRNCSARKPTRHRMRPRPPATAPNPTRLSTPSELDHWEAVFRKETDEMPNAPAPARDGNRISPATQPQRIGLLGSRVPQESRPLRLRQFKVVQHGQAVPPLGIARPR